jgi:hypothetical protein
MPSACTASRPRKRASCALTTASCASSKASQSRSPLSAPGVDKLRQLYAPHARRNFQQVADQFDKAAREFTTAATTVDPEADAETIVTATEDQRLAWAAAPLLAVRRDGLIEPLRDAAELEGVPTRKREAQHALFVDADGVHRRRVWEDRWGQIIKVGAHIRAADLDGFSP